MRLPQLLGGVLVLTACTTRPPDTAASTSPSMDSIVLERTLCFGSCPAYRLRVSSNAEVLFQNRNPGSTNTAMDTVAAWVPDSLYARAVASGFFSLPDTIQKSRELCPMPATDHPTIRIKIYGQRVKHVEYYTGCYVAPTGAGGVAHPLIAMRDFAARIDTLTQSQRWIQNAQR
jgi:hypothetical protein